MKVEIALRKNAEQFKEEVEARLDAERQARRICEKKLADVREELRKANEYIAPGRRRHWRLHLMSANVSWQRPSLPSPMRGTRTESPGKSSRRWREG